MPKSSHLQLSRVTVAGGAEPFAVIGQTAGGGGSQSNHALHHPEASGTVRAWAPPPTSGQADLIG